MSEKNLEISHKLVSKERSNRHDDARAREESGAWLAYSCRIAVAILNTLRNISMTQIELAEKTGIPLKQIEKIVRGGENLTLETITKLETALGIRLITITRS